MADMYLVPQNIKRAGDLASKTLRMVMVFYPGLASKLVI